MADGNIITIPEDEPVNADIGPDGRSKVVTDLWQAVSGLEARGTFACSGQLTVALPGLNINGYGEVGFPVRENEVNHIIPLCQPVSSYEKADEETKDCSTSPTWQLKASEFRLLNKEFIQQINSLVVTTIGEELGLGPNPLTAIAHISKLLIDTKDSSAYWDFNNDRSDRTFATLVVMLPSIYEGGDFVVQHQGLARTFKQENAAYSANYVAFFSSLKPMVQPVTSGYRLSLVYNIVSLDNGPLPQLPDHATTIKAMECLHQWITLPKPPSKAVFIIEHQYTPDGVPFEALRYRDKDIARILLETTRGTNLELYVALLTKLSSGSDSRKWESFKVQQLIHTDGERLPVKIPVDAADVFPAEYFKDRDADCYEDTSMSWNAVALVLLSKDKLNDLISASDEKGGVKYIISLVAKNLAIESREAPEWQSCRTLARLFLEKKTNYIMPNPGFLDALFLIGDVQLVNTYIQKMHPNYCDFRPEVPQLLEVVERCLLKFGWETFSPAVMSLVTKFFGPFDFNESVALLMRLMTLKALESNETRETVGAMARQIVKDNLGTSGRLYSPLEMQTAIRLTNVAYNSDPTLISEILTAVSAKFSPFKMVSVLNQMRVQIQGIVKRPEFIDVAQKILLTVKQKHLSLATLPDDWNIRSPMGCKCARVCVQIANFLKDPVIVEYHYKAAESDRRHAESSLTAVNMNYKVVTCTKDNISTPPTLIITKVKKEAPVIKQNSIKLQEMADKLAESIANDDTADEEERAAKRQKLSHDNSYKPNNNNCK